jgi:putative cell wall-binding protein
VGGASGFRERKTCKVPNRASLLGYRRGYSDFAYGLSHLATTTSLMEARVTTATRRLRRTGVATLAATLTAGVALIATATNSFAAELAVSTAVGSTAATTLNPGTTAQATGDLNIGLPNNFHIGDTLTVQLGGAGAGSCGVTNGTVGYASVPTVTASGPFTAAFGPTAGSATDTTPTFTAVLQSSAGACTVAGIHDQLLITLTNSSTLGVATDNYTLAVTGTKVNVGSADPTGPLTERPGTSTAQTVATVTNTKATIAEIPVAPGTSTGNAISPLVLSEVTAGAFLPAGVATTVTLTLTGVGAAKFTNAVTPTITVPAGYSVTPAATTASATYTFTVTAPATAVAATVTVTGLTVDLTGAVAGSVKINATTPAIGPAPAGIGGGALTAIGVLASNRTGGTDRYATAAQLFLSGGYAGGTNNVAVIASGANYPDALSANYLAAGLNAGAGTRVLLTDPNVLPQSTTQALITAGIKTVYIVGGTAAVSANVSNAIAAMHVLNNNANAFINVIRVSGSDRYATNNQVDLFNGAVAGVNTAIVAVGSNFADALSVSPAVVVKKFPLVLTDGAALSASAQSTLVNLGIKNVIIAGGTSAVSAATEASIKALGITIAYRIAGADRTLTAQMVATYETTATGTAAFAATTSYAALNGLGFSTAAVDVARGDGFADALAAGTVAGAVVTAIVPPVVTAAIPILLTGDPNTLGAGIPAYLSGKAGVLGTVTILGLTSAVSVATTNAVIASIS